MRCTGGRWGHVEDGGRKAARGQVTEAASVEEAEAWCVAAGDDVGDGRELRNLRSRSIRPHLPKTGATRPKEGQAVEYIYSYLLTIYFHRIMPYGSLGVVPRAHELEP